MRRILRHRPSPAMVIACLALALALGGTSYAAVTLPRNSVGTPQLKRNAVTTAKVRNGSLLRADFRRGQIPAGPRGPQGLPGAQGIQGIQGVQGVQGVPGPFPDGNIPAGKTIRGVLFIFGTAAAGGQFFDGQIDFGFQLAAEPTARYINAGTTPPPQCPGTVANPQAQAGNLCIYERLNINAPTRFAYNPVNNAFNASSRWGTGIAVTSGAGGQVEIDASWAVTSGGTAGPLAKPADGTMGAARSN